MTKAPAFQFYPADYLSDMRVRMLSWESRGLYIDLLCYCWREGWIPADSSAIAQLCHCHDLAIIEPCLSLFQTDENDPKRLVHKRLNEERVKQEAFRAERKSSGIKGSQKRWAKNSSAMQQPLAKNSSSSSSSSSSSDIPPTPKGVGKGVSDNLPTSPEAIRISKLYGRRPTTKWSDKEIRAFKAIPKDALAELDMVCRYTEAERAKGDQGKHRRDLATFLNNFTGELDRARAVFGAPIVTIQRRFTD